MKRTLIITITLVLGLAFMASCSSSGATTVAADGGSPVTTNTKLESTPSSDALPGQLQVPDVETGMEACAHQDGRRWNVKFLGPVRVGAEGLNFIDIREEFPAGVEEGPFLAAGYGLEESAAGDIGSFARLSAGYCNENNNLFQ